MKFIIVDRETEQSDVGILGVIGPDNVYLRAYAHYPDNRRPSDLAVGERIEGLVFRLSGQKGAYSVRRIE